MGDASNNEVSLELGVEAFQDVSSDSRGDSGCPSSHQCPSNVPAGKGTLSRADPVQELGPLLWKNVSCYKKPKEASQTMFLPGEGPGVEEGEGGRVMWGHV